MTRRGFIRMLGAATGAVIAGLHLRKSDPADTHVAANYQDEEPEFRAGAYDPSQSIESEYAYRFMKATRRHERTGCPVPLENLKHTPLPPNYQKAHAYPDAPQAHGMLSCPKCGWAQEFGVVESPRNVVWATAGEILAVGVVSNRDEPGWELL